MAADVQTQRPPAPISIKVPDRRSNRNPATAPTSIALRRPSALQPCGGPVDQNGCFEFDRVLKSGYVQKRTQKTKTWKSVYLVLRPSALSIYRSDKEERLRHKIYLSDLTAVTLLKDPKNKRQNVFGLFSPSRNFHFQASSLEDAKEWLEVIRNEARIEEEEEEMFLASPAVRRHAHMSPSRANQHPGFFNDPDQLGSSSPDSLESPFPTGTTQPPTFRRPTRIDSSGFSGNELASHSDFSDTDAQKLAVPSPHSKSRSNSTSGLQARNTAGCRSQASGINKSPTEPNANTSAENPDRIVWQGWLWLLRSKRGVRQWKNSWAVLRPRNLILYKNESEYSAQFIVPLSSIVNVVDMDPISRTKRQCMQIITEEKSYRFCAHDEEALVQCLGAFKSLLAKRRELEAKAKAANVFGGVIVVEAASPVSRDDTGGQDMPF